jgi:hypothetical protein
MTFVVAASTVARALSAPTSAGRPARKSLRSDGARSIGPLRGPSATKRAADVTRTAAGHHQTPAAAHATISSFDDYKFAPIRESQVSREMTSR